MQTILGAGGAIGIELEKALGEYTNNIRLVRRHPKTDHPDKSWMAADLTRADDVQRAVKGSKVVYLTVGLTYNYKTWQSLWPLIMKNVIDACIRENTRLVFFDNIYMYDPDTIGNMTEESTVNPISKKGRIRKEIAQMLLNEIQNGRIKALIARSADFYGPSIKNTSLLTEMVFNNLYKGKKAYWFASVDKKHAFTYTPDAARATALLGNTDDAYNQVWHLPTIDNAPTGREWIEAIAREMNVTPKYQIMSRFMLRLIGLFVPVMREMAEMLYQYDRDYCFNSSKFSNRFNVAATPYKKAIKKIIQVDYN